MLSRKHKLYPFIRKIVYWKRAIIDQSVSYLPSQSSLNAPSIVNLQSILIVFLILFWQHFAQGTAVSQLFLESLKTGKKALDANKYVGAILMDLSKAFDCLPHDLLLLKLREYGLSPSAINLVQSYLSNRSQCVKLGSVTSTYESIFKGVPQGSILGPVLFNIFINDIFTFVKNSTIYNYADDNTLSDANENPDLVRKHLIEDSNILIDWFKFNRMQANPEIFFKPLQ